VPIDWIAIGAAMLSGLLGGVHCVAMCGGVAAGVAVGAQPRDKREALRAAMLSNLGRVLGYTLAGLLVGGFGAGLIQLFRLDSLLFGMRMAVGLMLILIALRLMFPGRGGNLLGKPGIALWQKIAPLQRHLLPANTPIRQLALGMLWGWLPCGLSLSLLTAAWLTANAMQAGLMMAAFGLGTLPLMLPLTYSGARAARWLNQGQTRRWAATVVLFAGILTLAAPWLAHLPAIHGALQILGCATLPP